MNRFIYFVGILLILGFLWAYRDELPEFYPDAIVPPDEDELWELNQP